MKDNKKGFTLIELLLVMGIIAILATVIFVALDPMTRFRDARDSVRWTSVAQIVHALKVHQVDNKGFYLSAVNAIPAASSTWVYMITANGNTANCNINNAYCDVPVTASSSCIDLSGLKTTGYFASIPVSPNGLGTWSASTTGYTLQKNTNGTVTIRACESEGSVQGEISVSQ